jgi:hypothetical protein
MQNFNLELFSRLFFLNLSNTIKLDENFSIIPGQASPSASTQSTLEPPTPPRTPIQTQQRNSNLEKNYNNNNDDAKENYEYQSSSRNTPVKSSAKTLKCENESDYEDFNKRSHYNDDSNNFSDEEQRMGGRQSAVSLSMHMNGADSDREEESDYSSFDSSKLSLKNVESLLDKSSPVVSIKFYF